MKKLFKEREGKKKSYPGYVQFWTEELCWT